MKSQADRLNENISQQTELLSYFLNDSMLYFKVMDIVNKQMFTGNNRIIFDTFTKLLEKNESIDIVTLSNKSNLPLEDVLNVSTFFTGSPVPFDVLVYQLREYSIKDRLITLSGFISSQVACGTDTDIILSRIDEVRADFNINNTSNVITMEDAVNSLYKIIQHNQKSDREFTGIPTGFKIIDNHMGGLHNGDLIILAGETSHAKTSFALSMMFNSSVLYNEPCGIISHEMTNEQLTARLASYATDISSKQLLFGKLSDYEMVTFNNRINKLLNANIFIQDYIKRDLSETVASCRMMHIKHGIKYIVIENAGNIDVKGKFTDESRTSEISKTLKGLAKELNIPIILISHLAREKDGRKVQPSLHRLKHSGQLESDADVVLFVYRAELHGYEFFNDESDVDTSIKTEGKIKVFYGKGRNVGIAQAYLNFNEQTTQIYEDDTRTITPF